MLLNGSQKRYSLPLNGRLWSLLAQVLLERAAQTGRAGLGAAPAMRRDHCPGRSPRGGRPSSCGPDRDARASVSGPAHEFLPKSPANTSLPTPGLHRLPAVSERPCEVSIRAGGGIRNSNALYYSRLSPPRIIRRRERITTQTCRG